MERPSNISVKHLWNRALEPLRSKLPPGEFETWIQPMQAIGGSGDSVELAVPNRMFAAWVQERFLKELADAWVSVGGQRARFLFRWDEGAAQGELFRLEDTAPPGESSDLHIALSSVGIVPFA